MPSSVMTKRIFAEALKKLMESNPFTKISIGDIAKECSMNRNSFYYHFRDKYDLLNWIFLTEVTKEITLDEVVDAPVWELIEHICNYLYCNKSFYSNALSYQGQDSFLECFQEYLENLLIARSETLFEQECDTDFQQFYIDFFVDTILTSIMRWIKNGAKITPKDFTEMIAKASEWAAVKIIGVNI